MIMIPILWIEELRLREERHPESADQEVKEPGLKSVTFSTTLFFHLSWACPRDLPEKVDIVTSSPGDGSRKLLRAMHN